MANVGKASSGKTLIGKGNNSSPEFASIGTDSGLTNNAVVLSQNNNAFVASNAGTNGQVFLGATGADPAFATVTSLDGSVTFTLGANTLDLAVSGGTTTGKTITGNTGGALSPTAGNWNIVGTGSLTASGAVSTLTMQLTGLTNHAVLVGAGTATITKVGPSATAGQIFQSQGAAADPAFSTATYPSTATGTGTILRADGTNWVATTATYPNTTTANQLLYSSSNNVIGGLTTTARSVLTADSTGALTWVALTNGQLVIGSTAGSPAAASITSSDSSVTITPGSNSISLTVTGGTSVGKTITGDTGGALSPTGGNWNIVSTTTNGIDTSGSGSTLTIGMATPYADGDFEFRSAVSGATRQLLVSNTSNTASSQAKLTTSVAGTSAGDTWIEHAVGSSRSYAFGIDNSDSQKLKMTTAAAGTCNPSTATPAWTFTPATGFNYDNSGTTSLGIGFNADPTTNYPININKSLSDSMGIQITNPSTNALARSGINLQLDNASYDASILLHPDNFSTTIFQKKLVLNTQSASSSDGIVLNVASSKTTIFSVNNAEIVRVSGSGISFDAGSNNLGAYIQGSWTPTLGGSSADPTSITYSTQLGKYTQIGNVVYYFANVVINTLTIGSASGNLELRGLPITSANTANLTPLGNVEFAGIDCTKATPWVNSQIAVNSTKMAFIESVDNAAPAVTPVTGISAGDTIIVTGFYFTS